MPACLGVWRVRYIVRDSDSRLNARDRFAVEEWIRSNKSVHSVRDHVNHCRPLNGGLWGGVKGGIKVRPLGGRQAGREGGRERGGKGRGGRGYAVAD